MNSVFDRKLTKRYRNHVNRVTSEQFSFNRSSNAILSTKNPEPVTSSTSLGTNTQIMQQNVFLSSKIRRINLHFAI